MRKLKKVTYFLSISVLLLLFIGCGKMDATYIDYTKNIKVYTGKPDSVKVYPGDNRMKITFQLSSDPKISSLKMYWNNGNDSLVQAIQRVSGTNLIDLTLNQMPEGSYLFDIYTFDNAGNPSVKVTASGSSYGSSYKSNLLNRSVQSAELAGNIATINWYNAEAYSLNVELKYTDDTDVIHTVIVPNSEIQTILPNYKSGSKFEYFTVYRPYMPFPVSGYTIDIFASGSVTKGVYETVTPLYLKNFSRPFIPVTGSAGYDGTRWGILSDWITNTAAKNKGTAIKYGGYDNQSNNAAFGLEKAITDPAITNGKIFQTFTLPAGKYQLRWAQQGTISGSANTGADPRYLVAAAGTDLPDIASIATARASATFAGVASSTIIFTLSQQTQMSLGIVVSFTSTTVAQAFKTHGGFTLKYNPLP